MHTIKLLNICITGAIIISVKGIKHKGEFNMTADKVRLFFAGKGLADRITVRDKVSDTAEHSAAVIGCDIGQIAKTLSFLQDGKVVIILMSGEAKVDNKKYQHQFGMKSKMVPFAQVEDVTGYAPGAVSPYLLKAGTEVYLDVSLQRYQVLYTAAGSLNSTVRLTMDELLDCTNAKGFVDVCKNWQPAAIAAS